MGYFPNGTSFEIYHAQYCANCIHEPENPDDGGCPVILAHLIHNYDECSKPDSILHLLIPKDDENLSNKKCSMFWGRDQVTVVVPPDSRTP